MTVPAQPRFSADLYLERYPASEGTDVLRWSDRDISDPSTYQGGFKEGRIARWGPIRRAISDPRGDYAVGEGEFEIADGDYHLRGRLAEEETAYYDGRDLVVKGVTEAGRGSATPKVIARAKISEAQPTDGMGGRIRFQDILGSRFGPLGLESIVGRPWRRAVTPDIHRDYLDTERFIVPIIVGECSDYGAVDADGNDAAKGVCPGIFTGMTTLAISGPTPPSTVAGTTTLPPPRLISATVVGAGGSRSYTYGVTLRTATGQSTLSNLITVTGAPASSEFSTSNKIVLVWEYVGPPQYEDQVIAYIPYVGEGSRTPNNRLDTMNNGGTWIDPETTYDDDGDDSHGKGTPPPSKNTATIDVTYTVDGSDGVAREYGRILHAGHACHALHQIYGSDGGAASDPVRVEWDLDSMRATGELVDSDSDLWPHGSDTFIDIVGTDGVTERFFGYYLQNGPRLQHHIDGRVTIAANICGMTANAAGTGALVDQAAFAWQLVLCEWLLANDGAGYVSGAYGGVPDWADTTPMVSTSLVAAAQAQTALWLGTTKGYLTAYCLTTPITKREWLRRQNVSFGWFTVSNEFSQAGLKFLNTAASPTTGTYLRERVDEVVSIGAPRDRTDLRCNRLFIKFDWDADAQQYRSDRECFESTRSQVAHKAIYERSEEYFCVRDGATARDVATRTVALFERAPREIPIRLGRVGFDLTLLSQGLVTAHEGIGAAGYVLRPVQLVDQVFDLNAGEVDVIAWDVGRLLGGEFGVQGATDMSWGDCATTTETWGDCLTTTKRWG